MDFEEWVPGTHQLLKNLTNSHHKNGEFATPNSICIKILTQPITLLHLNLVHISLFLLLNEVTISYEVIKILGSPSIEIEDEAPIMSGL